ncbi:RrF2 family transcriptional regulator [Nocardia macrotermitis]|uniref:Putative HTH-type transcriptional regulator n=1 Tax=Nocardia macrotermitis TaxID=2585198 RepID=A0A7K0CWK2_9NOCA|nr:Rrf2 family transcriptional regulator [Nocardia macrotermitis]MQY17783.1 putative HTH-type transcriptional regulator [Nocardia macrotermitis]
MHISPRVDNAVRILLEIARTQSDSDGAQHDSVKAETIAIAQEIPPKILEATAAQLRRAGLLTSRRGPEGGYRLARPAERISIADVIRAVEGPLASVRGQRPEDVRYSGVAEPLQQVWIALRVNIRAVLEEVSIAQIATGELPEFVDALTADPGAWSRRPSPEGAVER